MGSLAPEPRDVLLRGDFEEWEDAEIEGGDGDSIGGGAAADSAEHFSAVKKEESI